MRSPSAVQLKVLHDLGPLKHLCMIIENSKLSSTENGDEEVQDCNFQSILANNVVNWTGIPYNFLLRYEKIDNASKINENLKDPEMAKKFEEKLLKDTKQSKNH